MKKIFIILILSVVVADLAAIANASELVASTSISPWDTVLSLEKSEKIRQLCSSAKVTFDSTHSYDVLHYDIFFYTPFTSGYFEGKVRIDAVANEVSLDEIWLHMIHLVADSVFLADGPPLDFSCTDTSLVISFEEVYDEGDTFSVVVYYHDWAQQQGYYYYTRNAYTMAEPYDARWWFPCFDEPWDKATGTIHISVPESLDVASNGLLVGVDTLANTITYHWHEQFPMATYLFCLAIADYAVWTVNVANGLGDSIPCIYYVYAEDSSNAVYDFATVPVMFDAFNDLFGPYPFEKYGMVAVDSSHFGAMEHQTMTTISRSWLTGDRRYEYGIAHELAHQWWGDMVTMSDFRHIWLNEGFATHSEALFNEYYYGQQAYDSYMAMLRDRYFWYDENIGRFPLFDPEDYFNAAEYWKGAWVQHMLRGIVGDDNFFAGLQHYGQLYRYGNASTEDYREAMEDIFGQDLDYFFHEWIYEQGYPEYEYAWNYNEQGEGYVINLYIRQVQQNSTVFSMPIRILIEMSEVEFEVTVFNSAEYEHFQIFVDNPPTCLEFDPDEWILRKAEEVTNIDDFVSKPTVFALSQNYPNPFNDKTAISFSVPISSQVRVEIFDLGGRLVRTIYDGFIDEGDYLFNWDGADNFGQNVAAGVYFCTLRSDEKRLTRKMTYIK